MTVQLDIANLALAHLAIGRPIAAMNEATQNARVMTQFYGQARDEALRDFNWPFARKFAALAQVATNPTPDWARSYRYPADCLFIRDLYSGSRRPLTAGARIPYIVGQDNTGRLIYTDSTTASIEYTIAISEASWPPDFVSAVSFLLAWYAAPSLTAGDPHKLGERARAAYQDVVARAEQAGENEQEEDLGVANLALAHLGIGRPATSSADQRRAARIVRQFYVQASDQALRDFNWPFARKFAALAQVAVAPTPDWGFSYRYPADCLFVRDLYVGSRRPLTPTARVPYLVGQDATGRLIYTDAAAASIEYTVAIDESFWPPDFKSALSLLLAWTAAPALTGGDPTGLGERARVAYQDTIARAQLAGETEQEEDLPVANLALLHLGVGRPEGAPDDQLRAMRAVRQLYAQVRDELFREFNWPFARKFVSLTRVAGPSPRASTDFAYSYRYPADCVAARTLRNQPRRPDVRDARVPFIVGQDNTGRLILTDAEPIAASGDWAAFPELEYTVVIAQALWPPDFLAAVAARLAWQAAPFVVKGDARQMRERARAEYEIAIERAWRAHFTEQEADPEPDCEFITARS